MTLFTISKPDQFYPFQHDLKNIPNKVTSNMKAASKQWLQKQTYRSFNIIFFLLVHAMF